MHWPEPKLALTPDPGGGSVLITVEHRVPTERAADFIRAMEEMRTFRRREGAVRWDLFRDIYMFFRCVLGLFERKYDIR